MANSHNCPISAIARILGRKWTLELLFYLRQHRHFCTLQEAAGNLSPSTLTRRLRELEREGLVSRTLVSTTPVEIEYTLTEKGRALGPALDALVAWTQRWTAQSATDEV